MNELRKLLVKGHLTVNGWKSFNTLKEGLFHQFGDRPLNEDGR